MNKFKIFLITLLVSTTLVPVVGCSSSHVATSGSSGSQVAPSMPPAADSNGASKGGSPIFSESAGGGDVSSTTDINRKIIKTGYITLVVKDVEQSLDLTNNLTADLGGYIVSSNKSENNKSILGYISIRIPADRYNECLARLHQLALKVPDERTDSQDVTEEYIDLQARLTNLLATEAQYLVLLNKAQTVQDILAVQSQLSNVRSQIEQLKGRIQYIDRTTDMSLVNVTLQQEKTVDQTGWSASSTLVSAVNGLITFGKVLANIVIWLLIFSPLWILIGVAVYLANRKRRKERKQA
jgi:hypothetical protein